MCGVVGTLRLSQESPPIDSNLLASMRDAMMHRGPDGSGLWLSADGLVGLGHRRLSIIDLDERASQPMVNSDGRFAITYNGEIYNYREVRADLEAAGVTSWRTQSDTEVVLNAFRRWGISCMHRFRGMFAFGIWDSQEKALWLVRDRIGVKPLYYAEHDGRLHFASEIKALLMDNTLPRRMCETGLFHYLSLMTTPAPHTLFEGISKLPGGCFLRVSADGHIRQSRWWDAWDDAGMVDSLSDDEHISRIRSTLETSVRYRGVADVPVGVFLSGGIDSSTNAALFAKTRDDAIQTFTVGYKGELSGYANEVHHAARMAREVGADHHVCLLDADQMIDLLPELVHLQDEPIADPVCIPLYYVSKLARDSGVTVAQVGEGADELYAGYPNWHRILRLQSSISRLPNVAAPIAQGALALAGKADGMLAETLRRQRNGEPFFWSGAESFTPRRKARLLSARMKKDFKGRSSVEAVDEIYQRFCSKAWEPSALNWMTYVDLNLRLPELLLMRVDKMSMGVSLECRVPFLDHELVSQALSVPTVLKLSGDTPKYALKRAVQGLIPDELIHRRKQGFGLPLSDWFVGRLSSVLRAEIDAFLDETDVLDRDAVNDLFVRNDASGVWWVYNLAAWHRHFIREWSGRAPQYA